MSRKPATVVSINWLVNVKGKKKAYQVAARQQRKWVSIGCLNNGLSSWQQACVCVGESYVGFGDQGDERVNKEGGLLQHEVVPARVHYIWIL